MKPIKIIVLVTLILNTMLFLGILYYIPYYTNNDSLSATLIEVDLALSARVIVYITVLVITIIFTQVVLITNRKMMDIKILRYLTKFVPIVPLTGLFVWMGLGLFFQMDQYDYAALGLDFVNANTAAYGTNLSHIEIINIGKSLNVGTGQYLIWIFVILNIILYIVYWVKFEVIYDLDDLS